MPSRLVITTCLQSTPELLVLMSNTHILYNVKFEGKEKKKWIHRTLLVSQGLELRDVEGLQFPETWLPEAPSGTSLWEAWLPLVILSLLALSALLSFPGISYLYLNEK